MFPEIQDELRVPLRDLVARIDPSCYRFEFAFDVVYALFHYVLSSFEFLSVTIHVSELVRGVGFEIHRTCCAWLSGHRMTAIWRVFVVGQFLHALPYCVPYTKLMWSPPPNYAQFNFRRLHHCTQTQESRQLSEWVKVGRIDAVILGRGKS